MSQLPIGHILDHPFVYPPQAIRHLIVGLTLKNDADSEELLSELSFTVESYKLESFADKTRKDGVHEALKNPDDGLPHTLAALHWIKLHGGKKHDPHQARIKFREAINSRPQGYAKHALASSLARILSEYTNEAVNTSRNNGTAATQNGALANIFQQALTLVDGAPLTDPFPYLKFSSTRPRKKNWVKTTSR